MRAPNEIFDSYFPKAFQERLFDLLYDTYLGSYDECIARYPPSELHDVLAHIRRARLERDLRELAKGFPGVSASPEPNHRNSSYYTLLKAGPVCMTVSAVENVDQIVRKAVFRGTLAQAAQLGLFDDEQPVIGDLLYGILLHGAGEKDKSRPAFARVRFPVHDCAAYVEDMIDFFVRFPDIVHVRTRLDDGTIEDKAGVRIRGQFIARSRPA